MRISRRIVPLVIGVTAAVGIAGVAALALPGITSPPPVVEDEPSVEATDDVAETLTPEEPATPAPAAKAAALPKVDPVAIAKARDSFPDVPKATRLAKEAKQAERVAAKKAEEQAAKEKAAAEQAAKEKAAAEQAAREKAAKEKAAKEQAAKDKDAAKKDATKGKHDKPKKDGDGSGKETSSAWWPEHVWAHLQSCASVDLEAGKVDGTWHVWLKYGGDWTYRSASPGPTKVTTHGDKVQLDYAATATVVKSHDGWHKAKAGPVSVTVDGPDGQSKTFKVDLWAKVAEDGTCH